MNRMLGHALALGMTTCLSMSTLMAQEKPAAPAPARIAAVPTRPAQPRIIEDPAVSAYKRGGDGQIEPGFKQKHERFLQRAKDGKIGVLFLGDSITEGWGGKAGKEVWEERFTKYDPANFGIGGDRTQHVIWRINNGELEGMSPKVIVLMIGTNNTGENPAESIAAGIQVIVKTIRQKLPETKVLLLAVFPRSAQANAPVRAKIKTINEIVSKLDDGKTVRYLDIGPKFLQPDGTLTKDIMPDLLHLSAAGYKIWADAITPSLEEMTK